MKRGGQGTGQGAPPRTREERLAEHMRANLLRRKRQTRARRHVAIISANARTDARESADAPPVPSTAAPE